MVGRLIATREESISLCSSGFSVCACGDAGTVRAFFPGVPGWFQKWIVEYWRAIL